MQHRLVITADLYLYGEERYVTRNERGETFRVHLLRQTYSRMDGLPRVTISGPHVKKDGMDGFTSRSEAVYVSALPDAVRERWEAILSAREAAVAAFNAALGADS